MRIRFYSHDAVYHTVGMQQPNLPVRPNEELFMYLIAGKRKDHGIVESRDQQISSVKIQHVPREHADIYSLWTLN